MSEKRACFAPLSGYTDEYVCYSNDTLELYVRCIDAEIDILVYANAALAASSVTCTQQGDARGVCWKVQARAT